MGTVSTIIIVIIEENMMGRILALFTTSIWLGEVYIVYDISTSRNSHSGCVVLMISYGKVWLNISMSMKKMTVT